MLCKSNFNVFYHALAISQQQGYQGFFKYGVYFFFETLDLILQYNLLRNKHVAITVSVNVKYLRIPII